MMRFQKKKLVELLDNYNLECAEYLKTEEISFDINVNQNLEFFVEDFFDYLIIKNYKLFSLDEDDWKENNEEKMKSFKKYALDYGNSDEKHLFFNSIFNSNDLYVDFYFSNKDYYYDEFYNNYNKLESINIITQKPFKFNKKIVTLKKLFSKKTFNLYSSFNFIYF